TRNPCPKRSTDKCSGFSIAHLLSPEDAVTVEHSGWKRWQLAQNRLVFDLAIIGKQKGLAEDEREFVVSLKREGKGSGRGFGGGSFNNAQVTASWFHEDVPAAQVNLVGCAVAPYYEKPSIECTSVL